MATRPAPGTNRAGAKTRNGRPGLLNDKVATKLVEAIKGGNYNEAAARYAGVSIAQFYVWMQRGRAERDRLAGDPKAKPNTAEAKYLSLVEAVEEAQAEAEVRNVALIQRSAQSTWQAAAWWLERKMPAKWGRYDRQEITGAGGGPVQLNVSTEDLEQKVAQVLSKRKAD
jgi:hypothetical protein